MALTARSIIDIILSISIQPSNTPKVAPHRFAIRSYTSVVRVRVTIDCRNSMLLPIVDVIINAITEPVMLTRLNEKARVQSKRMVKLIVQYIMKCTILSICGILRPLSGTPILAKERNMMNPKRRNEGAK